MLRNNYIKLSGKFRLLFNDLRTFPELSDLWFFSGITYRLTGGQGEFQSLQQYNLERGKVGEGWKGVEMKDVESGWSRQTCQLHTMM